MLFSIFLSLGHYNPLYPFVFKYVPFFNGIRYPVKFLYLFILVLSITAGLGFQRLTEFSKEGERKRLKNLLIALALASGLSLLFLALGHQAVENFLKLQGIDFPNFNHVSINLYHAKRFLFYLALFFLLLRVGYEVRWKGWIKILLVLFLAADLFGNMGFYGKERTSDYFRKTKISEIISSDKDQFRIFSTGKTISLDNTVLVGNGTFLDVFKEKHLPTMNLLCPLHDIWGIDVIRLKRVDDLYKAFTGAPSISATNLVELYGVKYVISVTPIEGDSRFQLVYSRLEGLVGKEEDLLKENTIKLYRNRNPLLRAWLVKDFKIMDSKAMLSAMTDRKFDPRKEVLVEEVPRSPAVPSPKPGLPKHLCGGQVWSLGDLSHKGGGGGGREVEFILEKNNELHLLVRAKENALLILSDTYFPGWKAYVDGNEEKIYRANYAFRAIPLSAGIHRVEFVYQPVSFKLGAVISFLGIIGCFAIGLAARYRETSTLGSKGGLTRIKGFWF